MRDVANERPRVLFITPMCPGSESHSGGLQVSLQRLKAIAEHAEVTVAAMGIAGDSASTFAIKGVRDIRTAGEVKPRNGKTYLQSWLTWLPISIWRNHSNAFLSLCKELSTEHWDLVYADHWLVWPAARVFKKTKKVLHLHNAEHMLFARAAEKQKMPVKLALVLETHRSAVYLRRACKEADEVHFLSSADREEINKIGGAGRSLVFNPAVTVESRRFGTFGGDILFAGTLSWQPNEEGLGWLVAKVAPLLPQTFRLNILGGQPTQALRALARPEQGCQIVWHGRVQSVTPFYETASVFVAPLLSGSGIKIKILNALSHGLPVITTTIGIEGFPREWRDCIHVADSPEEFAHAVELLANDRNAWDRASTEAQAYVARYFSGIEFSNWCGGLKEKETA
jgi:glycosyltransferase involved in cell wall biosynthesis